MKLKEPPRQRGEGQNYWTLVQCASLCSDRAKAELLDVGEVCRPMFRPEKLP